MGAGSWASRRSSKSFGERTYDKFVKQGGGDYSAYAHFASQQAWKTNSEAAHDEAAKAHDGAWAMAPEGPLKEEHAKARAEHEEASEKAAGGERPKRPAGGAFDEDDHARDDKGRFAPK